MKRLILLLAVSLVGCAASTAQIQSASSGATGCAPNEVETSGYQMTVTTSSWNAKCKGQTYRCSGSDTLKGVSCTPAK